MNKPTYYQFTFPYTFEVDDVRYKIAVNTVLEAVTEDSNVITFEYLEHKVEVDRSFVEPYIPFSMTTLGT